MGTAYGEPGLIKVASGFEAATHARLKPEFRSALPLNGESHRRHMDHDDDDSRRASAMVRHL